VKIPTLARRFMLPLCAALLLAAPSLARAGDEARAKAEADLARLDGQDAMAAYRLALDLASRGYADLATKAYEIVVGLDADHPAARRALGYERVDGRWLAGDDLHRAKGFVSHEGRWMTSEEFAAATRPQREAAEQKAGEGRVLAELARIGSRDAELAARAQRAVAATEPRFKLAPLAQALRCEPAALRVFAAEELGRMADPLAAPALLKRAIYDPDADVRRAVVAALKELATPSVVAPLVRALDSRASEARVRAAEALGMLGDQAVMGVVVAKWEARSGNFPQVYLAQMNQISYIQDFDVEVAQTSFIADPIVGVLQEGVVQSFRILATEQSFTTVERTALHHAMKSLGGYDLGPDPKAWAKFWNENRERLLRESEEAWRKAAAERDAKRAAK
jgi:hypothetical protein